MFLFGTQTSKLKSSFNTRIVRAHDFSFQLHSKSTYFIDSIRVFFSSRESARKLYTFVHIRDDIYYAINSHFLATVGLVENSLENNVYLKHFGESSAETVCFWSRFFVYSLVTRQNIQQCTFTRSTYEYHKIECLVFENSSFYKWFVYSLGPMIAVNSLERNRPLIFFKMSFSSANKKENIDIRNRNLFK